MRTRVWFAGRAVAAAGRAASELRDREAERVVGTEVNCQARIVLGREIVDMVAGCELLAQNRD